MGVSLSCMWLNKASGSSGTVSSVQIINNKAYMASYDLFFYRCFTHCYLKSQFFLKERKHGGSGGFCEQLSFDWWLKQEFRVQKGSFHLQDFKPLESIRPLVESCPFRSRCSRIWRFDTVLSITCNGPKGSVYHESPLSWEHLLNRPVSLVTITPSKALVCSEET